MPAGAMSSPQRPAGGEWQPRSGTSSEPDSARAVRSSGSRLTAVRKGLSGRIGRPQLICAAGIAVVLAAVVSQCSGTKSQDVGGLKERFEIQGIQLDDAQAKCILQLAGDEGVPTDVILDASKGSEAQAKTVSDAVTTCVR